MSGGCSREEGRNDLGDAANTRPVDTVIASRVEPMVVALAWFPAAEYQEALTRWPELATEGAAKGGKDHAAYNRALQRNAAAVRRRGRHRCARCASRRS